MPNKPIFKLNRDRHLANKMPKNPALEQRIAWHIEHSKNCACRAMPESIQAVIKQMKKEQRADKKT